MDSSLAPALPRLSVLITCSGALGPSGRGLAERAIQKILEQPDPIGTEIILLVGASIPTGFSQTVVDHLESIFTRAEYGARLSIQYHPRVLDSGRLWNIGAESARGSVLALMTAREWWNAGRLQELEPLLKRADLVIGTHESFPAQDWLGAFLRGNPAVPGSGVIRKSLFEELGGVPEFMPGNSEFELWLRAITHLYESDRRDRIVVNPNHFVDCDPELELPGLPQMGSRVRALQEGLSRLHAMRALPRRYWPVIAREMIAGGRELLRRKK